MNLVIKRVELYQYTHVIVEIFASFAVSSKSIHMKKEDYRDDVEEKNADEAGDDRENVGLRHIPRQVHDNHDQYQVNQSQNRR